MTEALALLDAAGALALRFLVEPYAAVAVGAFAGGWVMGAAKNRTALGEINRGLMVGISAGALVWLVQIAIAGGPA